MSVPHIQMTAPLVARKGHQRMDQIRAVIRAKLEDWKLGLGNTNISGSLPSSESLPSAGTTDQSCTMAHFMRYTLMDIHG